MADKNPMLPNLIKYKRYAFNGSYAYNSQLKQTVQSTV